MEPARPCATRFEKEDTGEEIGMSDFPAKILVTTDGSEDSALALQAAVNLSNDTGSELHLVHVGESHPVYPPPASGPPPSTPSNEEVHRLAQEVLDAQSEHIGEMGGKVEEAHLRMGRPAEEILRLSEDIVAGLIVVGNQGLSGRFSRMRRFVMGSVSENVTRYARCSVMVVRKDLYDRPSTEG
jgi:nucleotide-binding universal stress UspA family protein